MSNPDGIDTTIRAPLFVIGYPRSGTSFVGKLLTSLTGYVSDGESHVSTLLQEIHYLIDLSIGRSDLKGDELIARLDYQALKKINSDFFRAFYIDQYGGDQFIDKTPGAVACHGWRVVKSVFPNAAFVACVRSPVEVVSSFLVKFASASSSNEELCPIHIARGWVSAMEGLYELANSEFGKDLIVVSQLHLRASPIEALVPLLDFLRISQDCLPQAVELCATSREDTLTDSIGLREYKRLSSLHLSPEQETEFRNLCSLQCELWGIAL